ncbi:MAG TPA: GNAT family N-acetyltransferase [Anaerolineales bacterium]|jgi:GNAT superfamily N-acetyltransferase
MSWWVFQKWFNVAPWPNADYILDNVGEKFWIYWLDNSENVANLRMRYRSGPAGHVNIIREDEAHLTLADIHVKPEYRHRGLGKGLMLETLKWARKNNFREISGLMKSHDGLSEEYITEWYKRQGFQVMGRHIGMEL